MKPIACLLAAPLLLAAAGQDRVTRGVEIVPPTPTPKPAPAPTRAPAQASAPDPAPRPAPTPAATPPAPCVRAFPADLAYASARSDARLRALLREDRRRVVLDVAPFAPETPPAALAPWLAEVQGSDGKVDAAEISCTRGFSLKKLFSGLFGRRAPDYSAARGFDATLWREAGSGLVRQVEFRRRAAR